MKNDLLLISSTVLVCVCVIGTIMLWVFRKNSQPKKILSFVYALLSIWTCIALNRFCERGEMLDFVYSLFMLSLISGMFIYFCTLLRNGKGCENLIKIMFITVGGYLALYGLFLIAGFKPVHLFQFADLKTNIANPIFWIRLLIFIHYIVLLYWMCFQVLKMYKEHKKFIETQYSYRENISLSFLPYLVGIFVVIGIGTCFDTFFVGFNKQLHIFSNILYSVFYLVCAFFGVMQQDIYNFSDEFQENDNGINGNKSNGVSISPEIRTHLQINLKILMETEKVYRNPDLRLDTVAASLKTNRTYLSTVIKDDFGENFIGLVNRYRIEEAKLLLEDKNNKATLPEITEKIGFKSISSFNTFFKRYTGKSPASFRKES